MTPEEIRVFFTRRDEAHARHDAASLAAGYSVDCVLVSPIAGTVTGRAAIERELRAVFEAFPNLQFHAEELLVIADRVVQIGTMRGTDTGGFLGLAPTGKDFRVDAVLLFRLQEGQIVHEQRIYDFSGFLLQLSGSMGAVVESARLYRETVERARMEHELRTAAEIQRALLPESRYVGADFEVAAASISCQAIGGDFFDYFDLPNHGFGFALGDVAGKGPSAALLAAVLQGIFFANAQRGGKPAGTIQEINEALVRRTVQSQFATVFYGVLFPNGCLTCCNAGHNPPLLVGRSGVRRLNTGGLIVGAFERLTFDEEVVQLDPGDLLVAFSDGTTEAVNSDGEEFGEERLLSTIEINRDLSVPALLRSLLDTVHRFSGGEAPTDDRTILVLRYSGAS